jgi:hypothetical protein
MAIFAHPTSISRIPTSISRIAKLISRMPKGISRIPTPISNSQLPVQRQEATEILRIHVNTPIQMRVKRLMSPAFSLSIDFLSVNTTAD